jgi:hypothetical protein
VHNSELTDFGDLSYVDDVTSHKKISSLQLPILYNSKRLVLQFIHLVNFNT